MPGLPDCPECDSARTLDVIRVDGDGYRWCYCTSCAKSIIVDRAGAVVWNGRRERDVRDVSGNVAFEP